ncbi:MAG TPA: DUF1330 domain-containing protein [Steroidobacteraceae bacterium]|nr:DUF1330 domain-containing protein [Steroidobacteraceae bacterium]
MAAYLIADVDVRDAQAYEEYRQEVPGVIAAYGGRYLVRGGAVLRLEGAAAMHRVVVLEFADMAKLKAFYESAEYQRLIPLRQKASRSSLFAVEGV